MGTTSEASNNSAEMIRAARERRGWSQEALAEAAGVSQSTIDKIERGLTKRSRFLHAIANVLNLNLDEVDPTFERVMRLLWNKQSIKSPKDLERFMYEKLQS